MRSITLEMRRRVAAPHRLRRQVLAGLFAGVACVQAIAAERQELDALRSRFAAGLAWQVEFTDLEHKPMGTLPMRITAERASSCLGGMSDGVRVEFGPARDLSPSVHLGSYGVALLTEDKIKIDLTGGICDAYLLMQGVLAADGSSHGELYTFGMRGGHDIGTFSASIK